MALFLFIPVMCFRLLYNEAKLKMIPKRLNVVSLCSVFSMALVVLSHFTGLYYYFDENNIYHRGSGFLLSYIIPGILALVQYSVIFQYKNKLSKLLYTSLMLYVIIPNVAVIIQVFTYGLSLITMSMVMVSVSLYIFAYLDINDAAEKAHELEVWNLHKEQQSMKRLFEQTVTTFVMAVEKRDSFSEGHSVRVADTAKRIAAFAGKSKEECDEVYYAALLHDVGMMGIPDTIIHKTEGFTEEELRQKRQKPVLSAEILSSITEYPYLSTGARYSHERYDGKGYPDGLKEDDIPEIARIIAVADSYDTMITGKRSHSPMSYQVVREEFIKEAGLKFDPLFSDIMVQIMDNDHAGEENFTAAQTETELTCTHYRTSVSTGIPIGSEFTKIRFDCESIAGDSGGFSAPSVILFDSYDRHVHSDQRTIEAYRYVEYGEIWFDGHFISTNARNMEVSTDEENTCESGFEITVGRYEDHISICMASPGKTAKVIAALPDNSLSSFIGLTGENCRISNITITGTGRQTEEGDIRKIVSRIKYTDRLESDVPNIQIDYNCSAATEGITVKNELILDFHAMSLPSAELVWHCPYIVLFYSEDKMVDGKGYMEYAIVKLNGEVTGDSDDARNELTMKKNTSFPGWDKWKEKFKAGIECSVHIVKKGSKFVISTENLGISIENTTFIHGRTDIVYAALTGDRTVLTDIRVR